LALIQSRQQNINALEDDLPTQKRCGFICIVVAHGLRAQAGEHLSQGLPLHFRERMWPMQNAEG
jgi:hypothetical protein